VQVSDPFGDGSRTAVGLRGFGESANANTLVMVDGRRLNNIDIGVPDLNSVALKDIERIEIIQGSAGTLFGDQAVGGVINIITRTPRALSVFAEAGLGSYNAYQLQAGASQRLDNGLSYRLSLEKRETDNYRDNNVLDYENLVARFGYEHAFGSVFVDLQHVDEQLGTPGALLAGEVAADPRQAAFADDFSNTETDVQRFGLRQSLLDHWSLEAELTNRESEAEFVLSFRSFPGTESNFQNRHLLGFTPRLVGAYSTQWGDLLVTLGHDIEYADYKIDSVVGKQRNEQITRGTYAQLVAPVWPGVSLTLGARRMTVKNDLIDDFTFPAGIDLDDTKIAKEVGLTYRPSHDWRLFVRRDENVRFAKVDEFFDPPPGVILRTQTGTSYEAGVEWRHGPHGAKAVVYRLDLDREIAVAPGAGAFGFPANINLESTRRDGVILEGAWQALEALRVSANYSFVDARVTRGALAGKRIPFVAENIARAAIDYRVMAHWDVHAELQAVGERVFSGDFDHVLDELPGYGVVNLATAYRYKGLTLSARVNNLLDKRYSDFGARATLFPPPTFAPVELESFFPAPERNFWLAVRYDYD